MESIWIRVNEVRDECALYRFTKTFAAEKGSALCIRLSADSRYKLYVNGHFAVEGPCHGTRYQRFYETVDVTPYLKEGENTLWVDVLHVAEGHYISVFRESKCALWLEGNLVAPTGEVTHLLSDKSFKVQRFTNRKMYSYPGFIPSVPPSEEVEGEDTFVDVPTILYRQAPPEQRAFNQFGVRGLYPLTPRPIPNLTPAPAKPMILVKEDEKGKDYDAGRYETAYVTVTLTAKAGTEVKLTYAECKVLDKTLIFDNRMTKGLRDDPNGIVCGPYGDGLADRIRFRKDGTLTFTTFYYRAFRYIRLEANAPYTVDSFTFSPYYYPMGEEGKVTSSSEAFNRMWDISRHTVLCCAHDNYVDCPYYEQQQYDMDSALQMLFTFRMTRDFRLPRKSVSDLGSSQLPDGMIQANYPSTVVQVIPSFSLYWVMMLREYIRYTNDIPFLRSMIGTAEKALSGFEAILTPEGLVGATVYWPFVDWAPEWGHTGVPDGGTTEPLTMYTLLYSAALRSTAELCDKLGREGLAGDYRKRAKEANDAVNAHCFDSARGLYLTTPKTGGYAQQTAIWAVLAGAIEGKEAADMMEKAMTESISKSTFSMNHYLFRALEKTGLYDKYAPSVFQGWQDMMALHCTTWCESPDLPRSECHAWSSAPIYELSSAILGVNPTADGMSAISVNPRFNWFEQMQGTVPTPLGEVYVAWNKQEDGYHLTVKNPAPDQIALTVMGEVQEEGQKEYIVKE